ncbi:hypothetical protein HDU76_008172 [Blyttiomyces sp. JEL0837]|nr:hypothetical protein HDU76_008172 [Blyttiomyces sp. JEL0837]
MIAGDIENPGDGVALIKACQLNRVEIVAMLLESGANVFDRDGESFNVASNMDIVRLLWMFAEESAKHIIGINEESTNIPTEVYQATRFQETNRKRVFYGICENETDYDCAIELGLSKALKMELSMLYCGYAMLMAKEIIVNEKIKQKRANGSRNTSKTSSPQNQQGQELDAFTHSICTALLKNKPNQIFKLLPKHPDIQSTFTSMLPILQASAARGNTAAVAAYVSVSRAKGFAVPTDLLSKMLVSSCFRMKNVFPSDSLIVCNVVMSLLCAGADRCFDGRKAFWGALGAGNMTALKVLMVDY